MPELFGVKDLKRALITAGFEVFRVRDDEIHLAERQNVQLMEAGVRVRAGANPQVAIVARAQRNDAPSLPASAMFDAVRARLAPLIAAGYREVSATAREIRNVSDPNHVLDVWYEVTLVRDVHSLEEAIAEVGRAFQTERYIIPER